MGHTATKTLKEANRQHTKQRDSRVRSFMLAMSRWARSLERDLLGTLSADRGGTDAVRNATDVILAMALPEAAVLMRRGLADLALWSWDDETKRFIAAVPVPFWLRRVMPVHTLFSTEGTQFLCKPGVLGQARAIYEATGGGGPSDLNRAYGWTPTEIGNLTPDQICLAAFKPGDDGASLMEFEPDASFDINAAFRQILAGELTKAETLDVIRELEFGSPTPEQLNAILEDAAWSDGLNAMERIVTVPMPEIAELRRKIHEYLALPGPDRASAWGALSSGIGDLVGTVNFKAVRIARTEGTRVAEDMLRESWKEADEFITGIQTFTANDENVRRFPRDTKDHKHWHEKIFHKTSRGQFIAEDGERLPRFPADPNCRCWDTPVMLPEIEAEIANVSVGREYQAALDRFEKERA